MREIRTPGSARGVVRKRYSYRNYSFLQALGINYVIRIKESTLVVAEGDGPGHLRSVTDAATPA